MSKRMSRRAKSISRLRALFFVLFLAVSCYLVYDVLVLGPTVSMNAYNPRLGAIEGNTVRGTITDRNGVVLAETMLNENGMSRYYPYAAAFAHTVGFVGKGKAGIEDTYNLNLLASHENLWEKFKADLTGKYKYGDGLKLTLDSSLQLKAFELLEGQKGAVAAIEPSTGRILALVSRPSFDPNTVEEAYESILADKENARLLNRASQGLYPPGSTFKVLTTLAYMMDNRIDDFTYDCDGFISVDGKEIHCYGNTAHGELDLISAFAYSCNTSYASISKSLSMETMNSVADAFGFNRELPYLPVSSVSRFGAESGPGSAEWAETLIGQGKTMISPLHNAMIAAAIANGGRMMEPYIVDSVIAHDGNLIETFMPVLGSQPMTTDQAAELASMMSYAVEAGTAYGLKNENYLSAGKTGSAENPSGAAHAWFIGYAPLDNPQIALAVIIEHGKSGSAAAVPIAKELFDTYL